MELDKVLGSCEIRVVPKAPYNLIIENEKLAYYVKSNAQVQASLKENRKLRKAETATKNHTFGPWCLSIYPSFM
jgi:hypothetical protein